MNPCVDSKPNMMMRREESIVMLRGSIILDWRGDVGMDSAGKMESRVGHLGVE